MFAIVEINHIFLKLTIYEKKNNSINVLEKIIEQNNIFKNLKDNNKISIDEINNLCLILKKMEQLCEDYCVKNKKIIFNEFYKNILNFSLLVEQIKITTDFVVDNIELVDNSNLFIKKLVYFQKDIFLKNNNKLFLNLNSLETCIYLFYKGKINFNNDVEFSGERLYYLFEFNDIQINKLYSNIYEILKIQFSPMKNKIGRKKIEKLVIDAEIEKKMLKTIFKNKNVNEIKIQDLETELDKIKKLSYGDIAMHYKCSIPFAKLMVIKIYIILGLYNFFDIKTIEFLNFSTTELYALEYYNSTSEYVKKLNSKNMYSIEYKPTSSKGNKEKTFSLQDNNYISSKEKAENSLWRISTELFENYSKKFGMYSTHNEFIKDFGIKLLDAIKNYHVFSETDYKKYIMASYLYNIGSSINYENFEKHSGYIIRNLNFFSETDYIKDDVAKIVENLSRSVNLEELLKLLTFDNNFTKNLQIIAILRLVLALDLRKKQTFHKKDFSLNKNKLVIILDTTEETNIEMHMFDQEVNIFEYLFNINVELKINRRLEYEQFE